MNSAAQHDLANLFGCTTFVSFNLFPMLARICCLCFAFALLSHFSHAQNAGPKKFEWTYEGFIENKGQFDGRLGEYPAKILYAADHGGLQIYFTDRGVSLAMYSTQKNYLRKKGEKGVPRMIVEHEMLHITWENMSAQSRCEGLLPRSDYHSYPVGTPKNHKDLGSIKAFRKLVYGNIYPQIDLEYTFHPEGGLKYAFIVKPGGNPDDIRMRFSGKRELLRDENGNLLIETLFGPVIDHKPVTFYRNNPDKIIPSEFFIEGQSVGFKLDVYDKSQPIIIDPWTVTPNAFSNSNKIWEIETDQSGNVYVYGGDSPMRLRKYNAAGVLQWTYNTPWDTANYWVGTLKTDLAGNSYITSGTSGTLRKINTAGNMDWTAPNTGPFPEIEFWSLAFNCDYSKLYCGGMRASSGLNVGSYRGTLFDLSLVNGTIQSFKEVGFNTGGFIPTIKEVRSIAYSPNQNLYYLTLDSVGGVTPAPGFNVVYQIPSGYNFTYGIPDYGVTNQGIHAVAATENILYTMNGNTLHRRNINNGAILSTATIPGGINNTVPFVGGNTPGNSGLVLDSCGNVYVGSANAVHKFGPNLNLLTSFSTPAAVYDVAINFNGEVVACGNNFIASIGTLSPCTPPAAVCLNCIQIIPVPPICNNASPITLSVNQTGGTWSGPGITNAATGAFNPAVAGPGTHVIFYNLNPALTCGADSIVITVNNCANPSVCVDANGNLVASGGAGGPYTWQQQATQQDCSTCFFGLCNNLPPGCVQNITVWNPFATGVSITPPANFPIRLVDANGNFVQINNLAEVLPCTNCPGLSVSVSALNNVTCNGQNNGSATVTASGGTAPYTFVWTPGNLNGPTQNNLAPGNYTVNVTDAQNCTGSVIVTISQPAPLIVSPGNINPADCNTANGSAGVTVNGGTAPYSVTWSTNPTQSGLSANGLAAGNYTVQVQDSLGCTANLTLTVPSLNGPTVQISQTTDVSCFDGSDGQISVEVAGGSPPYSFAWSPSGGSGQTASGLTAGLYTVTVTDASGCEATASATLSQNDQILLLFSSTPATCGLSDGSAQVDASGGVGPYTYVWAPSGGNASSASGIPAGNYTVTVTDSLNCSVTGEVNVGVIVLDSTLSVIPEITPESCAGNDGAVLLTVSGGEPPYTFTWSNGIGSDTSWAQGLTAGTYTVSVGDQCYSISLDIVIDQAISIPSKNLPNIITPNGDGVNDILDVGQQFDSAFDFAAVVYNRWGVPVHKTENKSILWAAANVSDGVYFIVVTYTDCTGKREKLNGTVTVSR